MDTKTGTCPTCNGTKREPATGQYKKIVFGYDEATDTFPCGNCGGQKQGLKPTGTVFLREDGSPCQHEYIPRNLGRCYNGYKCKFCPDYFTIDSSD